MSVIANGQVSDLWAAMADGIGELTFLSSEWVDAARDVLNSLVAERADGLSGVKFSFCEVAHNPPAYLRVGSKLAWNVTFDGDSVAVNEGEIDASDCDFRLQGEHAILSNMARLQYKGRDPKVVAAAQGRLGKLGRWEFDGKGPESPVLGAVLRGLHDDMAGRTMPRFTFMTPEWVNCARHILTTRADKYADRIKDVVFTFSEEFTDTPAYAFPDGSHGGFWLHCDHGNVTVGAGPLPTELEPADMLTKGMYTPVVPVGRTVNAAMTEEDQAEQAEYSKAAFRFDKVRNRRPVEQTQPSGKGPMPSELGVIFMPLHDELSKRTANELPCDFDHTLKAEWSAPPRFDRDPDYDPSWLNYEKVDIYGNAR